MHARLLTAVLLARTTLAFRDTYPVVGWSSHVSPALDSVASTFTGLSSIDDVFNHLFSDDSICSHDAVLLIDSPGLHASDLRTLSPSSPLTVSLGSAQSAVQLPYAKRSSADGLAGAAEQLAQRCGGQVTQLRQDVSPANLAQQGGKHVLCMSMPELSGAAVERKDAVAQHAALVMGELERVAAAIPNHLILLAGGPSSPSLFAREMPAPGATFESDVSHAIFPAVAPAANGTLVRGGILARYQLLTPGLILGFLVSFFVLVPVLFAGISALSSIQAPMNMAAPKGYSADTKKTQ